jgi:hypothetical protein
MKERVKTGEKTYSELTPGDILKRTKEGFYYELKDIVPHSDGVDFSYSFFGFVVRYTKNLKYHFTTNNNLFEIY